MDPIRVAVIGAAGRMGREVVKAVCGDPGMRLVAAVDRESAGTPISELVPTLQHSNTPTLLVMEDVSSALDACPADVLVDFSHASVVGAHAVAALSRGCAVVIGATGLSAETLDTLREAATSVPILYAPNFALGAVLMMKFSEIASRWYSDAEIIELHHDRKEDAPSGTAMLTAEIIANARVGTASEKPKPVVKAEGALGGRVQGIPVHSVRLPGLLAHQQVMFGAPGETLTIRHDSTDRAGFMTGVLLAIREVRGLHGLVIGLDNILFRGE